MSFTRSASGIKNYSKFYGKYFMFYIEGKKASASKTRDELFYEKLLETVLGHQSFKIKTVGNKIDVLDYWEKIRQQNSTLTASSNVETGRISNTSPLTLKVPLLKSSSLLTY